MKVIEPGMIQRASDPGRGANKAQFGITYQEDGMTYAHVDGQNIPVKGDRHDYQNHNTSGFVSLKIVESTHPKTLKEKRICRVAKSEAKKLY